MIKLLITSGKGGVGKTTITANLGAAFALDGKRVVLIDGDAGLRNLDISLGLSTRIVYDALDILDCNVAVEDAVISHPLFDALDLVAAPQKSRYKNKDIVKLCNILDEHYDIAFIDCPAGVDAGFSTCALASDYAIIIATPDVSSVRDAISTKEMLASYNLKGIYAIVNRSRPKMARRGQCMRIKDVEEILECRVIGSVQESSDIVKAGNLGIILERGKPKENFIDAKNNLQNLIGV